jgi:predicted ATP-binding protein involved in virulence
VYGFGAGRQPAAASIAREGMEDGAANLFNSNAQLRNAEEWLLGLDYSASKPSKIQQTQKGRLSQAKRILIDILPDVLDIRFTTPTEKRPRPRIEFETHYGWVPLGQLGHGYQTLIAWMVDFASRMVDRYPDSKNPLAEPAVVLVDEIDLHLHPTWQRKVMSHLTTLFPNTQFIVTAHSPLIVQAAANANIALLRREGDHVVIDNDVENIRGWRIDQILTSDLYGLETARPPDMEEDLKRRKKLLTKNRLTKAEKKEVEELEKKIGFLPGGETGKEASKMIDLLEKSNRLLEKYQSK